MKSLVCFFHFLWIHAIHGGAECYYPDGSVASDHVPCFYGTNSVCCGQGYACLTNKICQATGEKLEKDGANEYVRGSCTDPEWSSRACPSFCKDSYSDITSDVEGLIKCSQRSEDSYFCLNRVNDQRNCDTGENLIAFSGEKHLEV